MQANVMQKNLKHQINLIPKTHARKTNLPCSSDLVGLGTEERVNLLGLAGDAADASAAVDRVTRPFSGELDCACRSLLSALGLGSSPLFSSSSSSLSLTCRNLTE